MKKFFVLLVISFFSFFTNCEKIETIEETVDPQPKLVREFLNSQDFKNNECLFENYGQIGVGTVELLEIPIDSAYNIMIPIKREDTLKAYIQVIKLPKGELPDGGTYLMNFIDMTRFDNPTLTGYVRMLGVNYGYFEHSTFRVENNIIVTSNYNPTPAHYLDEQTKGIRDFLACYRATRSSMDNDDVLYFLCDVVGSVCAASAAAYCIFMQQ
ncbi:MAG: hypothetical protein ACP5NZ_01715 [Nanobdellota archaeon]